MALLPISEYKLYKNILKEFIYPGIMIEIKYYNKIPILFMLYNTINNKTYNLVSVNSRDSINTMKYRKKNAIKSIEEYHPFYTITEVELCKKAIDKFFRYICHIKFDKKNIIEKVDS